MTDWWVPEEGGTVSFETFMASALYHPERGYYSRRIRTLGRRGDFTTWPMLDASLSDAIASWLRKERARQVIEVGAGTGALAAAVLARLGFLRRARMRFHIVEISPVLREVQRETLRGRNVVWHDSIQGALSATDGEAHIYSNELVDAFPCRAFLRSGGYWRELGLEVSGSSAREVLLQGQLPKSSALSGEVADGGRVEVHESYRNWLAGWAPDWRRGTMLTMDYGDIMPGLYHRRPSGTIRAYSHHQRLTGADVFSGFGSRDITADVNFTDLQAWGLELGWKNDRFSSLGEFLADYGIARERLAPLADAAQAFRALLQSPACCLNEKRHYGVK